MAGPQLQLVVVENLSRFGIRREKHLNPAIKPEAVNTVGTYPSSHRVPGFQDEHPPARLRQVPGAGQTGESGPHDDDRLRPCVHRPSILYGMSSRTLRHRGHR